ncbi:SapC family protein [Tsuneonella sp. YG55]|uniref:SapC family protein n=1 Tax=Tsuneonella litorea TaxID=2976475 RepID=A0A9X2W1W8_9SPHN|nr:SapC family protein [Tsuneonella litorea]MCT2559048.1 SapC family protein [Tsuneonella litorea]
MASAPQPTLPLFYNDLMPLNSRDHATWKSRPIDKIEWLKNQHAVPLTVEEFAQAQRDFPIIFSAGDQPVPLALMGLNEGVNTFIDDEGKPIGEFYLPAYVRRYPFLLAKLTPQAEELSLCFDPTCDAIGDLAEGDPLFDEGGQPGAPVKAALEFCEQFEQAGAKTQAFMEEIKKHDLLMDGEIAITRNDDPDKPYVYRGFGMIDQEKLRALDPATVKEWNENGLLPLIYAHMFSLDRMRVIFSRQIEQDKLPAQVLQTAG